MNLTDPPLLPGTIVCTRGEGAIGWVIRHGSGAFYAHSAVVVAHLEGTKYLCVEAFWAWDKSKSGVRLNVRDFGTTPQRAYEYAFIDIARNEYERDVIVRCAVRYVGTPYDTKELARIALRGLGIKWDRPSGTDKMICSHHVTEAVCAAIPMFEHRLPVPPGSVWPGLLLAALAEYKRTRTI